MPNYAGIGSRKTPPDILAVMHLVAGGLAELGWTLRTGGAESADEAFLNGALDSHGRVELYLPWPRFRDYRQASYALGRVRVWDRPTRSAYQLAERYHPNWKNLRDSAKSLHAQNAHQVLGPDLTDPVRMLVCWTPGGNEVGGTAQALRIARDRRITVFNLARAEDRETIRRLLGESTHVHAAQQPQEQAFEFSSANRDVRDAWPSVEPLR